MINVSDNDGITSQTQQ